VRICFQFTQGIWNGSGLNGYICWCSSDSSIGEGNPLLIRQNTITREQEYLWEFCSNCNYPDKFQYQFCRRDECVPKGKYQYGFDKKVACDSPNYISVVVENELPSSCTRNTNNPPLQAYSGELPWLGRSENENSCDNGCSIQYIQTEVSLINLAIAIICGIILIARTRKVPK